MKTMKISFSFTEMGPCKKQNYDFSCYFFEQGYLHYCCRYHSEICYGSSSYPSRGKRVSDFLFRPQFLFYAILKKKFQKNEQIYPFFDIK